MTSSALAVLLAALSVAPGAASTAPTQWYTVTGSDTYRVGKTKSTATIVYRGRERLSIVRDGKATQYSVSADYRRSGDDGVADAHARFVQRSTPKEGLRDETDEDPDFLTILNQPFAIQLDVPTLGDLRALRGPIPFDATSPLGGDAALRGFLRPGQRGKVNGLETVAVRFEAEGVMAGPLPMRTGAQMSGQVRMVGTAYYASANALLLALHVQLTIVAHLHDASGSVPVTIVYARFIRAAKMPPPTPLPSGAETASPATP